MVPVYNESIALRSFVPELLKTLHGATPWGRWEVIFVDDGSDDDGPAFLARHEERERVIALRHPRRIGSGAARRTGSARACGEWVAWIDADGTYDPQDLEHLLRHSANSDQVIGTRDNEQGRWKLLRRAAKTFARSLASALLRTQIPDLNSGLRIIRRQCLAGWIEELPDGFSCTSTATLAALRRRQRVRFVPIGYRSRLPGSSSKFDPIFDTLRLFKVVLRYGFLARSAEGRSSRI
ncbi:MAG: glycosyltransferase family 2 protein [Opitutaceae bacterium]